MSEIIFEAYGPLRLKEQFRSLNCPRLPTSALSVAERGNAKSLVSNLQDVKTSAENFASAVALFQYSRQEHAREAALFRDWLYLAGREGAIAIRNYATALAKVRSLVGTIPSWLSAVDTKTLKVAEKEFYHSFPFAHKMRHAIAHPEFYSDPSKNIPLTKDFEELGMNFKNNLGGITIKENILNNNFSATFEGAVLNYELDSDSVKRVVDINNNVFTSFDQLEEMIVKDVTGGRGQTHRRLR